MAMNTTPTSNNNVPKVAVFYPYFAGGGAECVGLWILEALKEKYDLTLVTLFPVDLQKLNIMYGTQLEPKNVQVRSLFGKVWQKPMDFLRANSWKVRMWLIHLLLRYLKSRCQEYDLVISGYNAADLGSPGVQYIHWIKVLESKPFYNRISQFSIDRMKENIAIANSQFVANKYQESYNTKAQVVYPPVVMEVQEIPWEQKEDAFICSGRLTKPKSPHKAIEILRRVREKGFDIKLYLTGGGSGTYAFGYQRFLQKIIDENSDWVVLYKDLPYKEYIKVVSKCKYGIHCKPEPFGISIAEMVKANAVPFVKDRGGQVEIVGEENEDLLFRNPDRAVEKIVALLSNPEQLQRVRASLQKRQTLFSSDRFTKEIQEVVGSSLAQKNQPQTPPTDSM